MRVNYVSGKVFKDNVELIPLKTIKNHKEHGRSIILGYDFTKDKRYYVCCTLDNKLKFHCSGEEFLGYGEREYPRL